MGSPTFTTAVSFVQQCQLLDTKRGPVLSAADLDTLDRLFPPGLDDTGARLGDAIHLYVSSGRYHIEQRRRQDSANLVTQRDLAPALAASPPLRKRTENVAPHLDAGLAAAVFEPMPSNFPYIDVRDHRTGRR